MASAEQIIVYDMAIQTAMTGQSIQESETVTGGATGTSLQTYQVSRQPNAVKCCEERQLRRVFLPKELAQGKQFRPRTPPVKQKEYPIIRFIADLYFQGVATQLHGLVRFFNSNTIGPFMYNEELDFFIARFRKTNSARWPYLRYVVNKMYKKYYQ